jgi:hypothetical protein
MTLYWSIVSLGVTKSDFPILFFPLQEQTKLPFFHKEFFLISWNAAVVPSKEAGKFF